MGCFPNGGACQDVLLFGVKSGFPQSGQIERIFAKVAERDDDGKLARFFGRFDRVQIVLAMREHHHRMWSQAPVATSFRLCAFSQQNLLQNGKTVINTPSLLRDHDSMNAHTDVLTQSTPSLDVTAFPQTAKFMDWYRSEQSKGLVDIKFFTTDVEDATLETFFGEVNAALIAKPVVHPDFF